jgi:hypothetical protein
MRAMEVIETMNERERDDERGRESERVRLWEP